MNSNSAYKQILPEVQKLLHLYLTVPVTTLTSKKSFSMSKGLLAYMYLQATMTEKHLHNCMVLRIHKEITDELDLVK